MSSTFLSLHYHIIFSTKHRVSSIDSSWLTRLHQYLGGTIKHFDGTPEEIGGISDHVHILVGLKSTHCLADFVREIKKSSSIWFHETIGMESFAWQVGYSAFTISKTSVPSVKSYIQNQEEHHRQKTSREELIELLELAGIQYDPLYLE